MIKLFYMICGKPDIKFSQFSEHWLHQHRFGERMPALSRYVQYHAEPDLSGQVGIAWSDPSPARRVYDGVAVAWWRSAESLRLTMTGPVVAEAIEDELRFIDHSRSLALLADEHVVREPEPDCGIVVFRCVRRAEGLTRRAFGELWRQHGESDGGQSGGVKDGGYLQDVVLDEADARVQELDALGTSDASWDGISARYFRSAVLATRFFEAAPADDVPDWMSGNSAFVFTRRHTVKQPAR